MTATDILNTYVIKSRMDEYSPYLFGDMVSAMEEYANLQLIEFSKWKEQKGYSPIYDHNGLVDEFNNSTL